MNTNNMALTNSSRNLLNNILSKVNPNWFAMTMGTGITAICLNTLSSSTIIKNTAATIWELNVILFSCFAILFILKILLNKNSIIEILHSNTQSMFLGCIPMGLITIVNGFILFGQARFGNACISIAISLWWVDVVLALLSLLVVPYWMFHHQAHESNKMTAVWLLPFVACEVTASSFGVLMPFFSANSILPTFILSITLWSASVGLALGILVILFKRLAIHKVPSGELAATLWLPLGPTGTGAFAMFILSQNTKFISSNSLVMNSIAENFKNFINLFSAIGIFSAIVLWTLATWWTIIAVLSTARYMRNRHLKFNLGYWGFTFPLGVYTMSTVFFGKLTGFSAIIYYGNFLAIALFIIWIIVASKTIQGIFK